MKAEQIYIVHADSTEQKNFLKSVFKLHKIRFEVADENIRKGKKSELQKSIEEAHKGKYFVAKDADDLIRQCLL